jgi:hypothetical protein
MGERLILKLTSRPPLKQTVLGFFDFAEIITGSPKNKQIDGFCAVFFAVDW